MQTPTVLLMIEQWGWYRVQPGALPREAFICLLRTQRGYRAWKIENATARKTSEQWNVYEISANIQPMDIAPHRNDIWELKQELEKRTSLHCYTMRPDKYHY